VNILITGGLGHIGSYFLNNFSGNYNYSHERIRLKVVDNLLTHRYATLFDLDRDITFLDKDMDNLTKEDIKGTDVVIHLAAITNAEKSFKNKDDIEEVNIRKTEKFINLCKDCKVPRFIFPSSTSVYGVASDVVHEDDDNFINPQSPYAESKIKIENMIKNELGKDTKYLILRFGTIFGTSVGMRFHTAINKFCYEVVMKRPLTIWKQNYEQYRPYLGLNDALRSVEHFIIKDDDCWNNTYNVLSLNSKLKDIISCIEETTGKVELNMVNTPLLNQFSYKVNDNKVKNTGFIPTDKLVDSVKDTLHMFRGIK